MALVAAGCSFPTTEFTLVPPADTGVTDMGPPPDTAPADTGIVPPDTTPADTGDGAGGCRTSAECSGTTPICDAMSGRCGACNPADDRCPAGTYCGGAAGCMPGCRSSADCPMGGACNTATHRCGCATDMNCGPGTRCCTGACVDVQSDAANCGACGMACPGGGACCAGACANTMTEAAHCGGCGRVCDPPNATPACAGGTCGVGTCEAGHGNCDMNAANGCEAAFASDPDHCGRCGNRCAAGDNATAVCAASACAVVCNAGYGDCDGNPANGCEADLRTSSTHCGRCGRACTAGANATATCAMGECTARCNAGFGDCDEDAANGCETNTNASATHCGGCGQACAFPNATGTCAAGVCSLGGCNSGFRNCDSMVANGCEQNISTDTAHCGACRTPCSAGQVCSAGLCTSTCTPAPLRMCGAACVDTSASLAHCGACGNVCGTANATAACATGTCRLTCNTGFADCDAMAATGCETNVNTDVANCGGCRSACDRTNGTPTCMAGACQITCNAGFANCDMDASDGCETATATDVRNCGACGRACAVANGTASCAAGACGVASCTAGYGNCDGMAANGCETNVNNDNAHCGRCANACPTGTACSGGACSSICRSPYTFCSGRCVLLTSDERNCGACGRACLTGQICSLGRCSYPAPANDRCTAATEINLSAGSRISVPGSTLYAAHDLNSPCGTAGTNDVFYRFTLTRREFVYADTFGASWDTRLFFATSCTAAVTSSTTSGDAVCSDNTSCATGGTASQVYAVFNPGTYYLVLSSNGSGGSATIRFEHLPVGNGIVSILSRGTTIRSGTTSGSGLYRGTCGGDGPDNTYWWATCPDQASGTFTASTCGRATWNTILNVLNGSSTGNACNNDSTSPVCGQQSTVSTTIPSGSGLHLLIVDGFSTGMGSYSVAVTRP